MKQLFFIFLLLGSLDCYSQSNYPSPFEFQVIESPIGTKGELFVKANEWVVNTFKSAKDVIQMSDKDAGKIIAKGIMQSNGKVGIVKGIWYIKFTLSIDVKDNKCRIKVYDYIAQGCQSNGSFSENRYFELNYSLDNEDAPSNGLGSYSAKTWNDIKYTCTYKTDLLIKEAIAALNSKTDNW